MHYGFDDKHNLLLAGFLGFIYIFAAWQAGKFAQRAGYFTALKLGFSIMAVSLAGGLTERGSDRGMKIIRITDNKRHELDVKETDSVLPNDTIQIRQKFF